MGRIILLAAAVRLVAALVLVVGPWTDSEADLAGWDVERFQAIAQAEGRPWVDEPVEYPPGSVALIEAVAIEDVVGTHRVLVLASLAVDALVAAVVARLGGRRAAAGYLVLGTPLVPLGLLRFDLWATLAAVGAVAMLRARRSGAFAVLVTVGALIKVWPALVVATAAALGRWRTVGATAAVGAVAGVAWLAWAGGSLDPVAQVLSMRGATGWHIESVPGSLVALATGAEPVLDQNAYRIGTLDPGIVAAGRVALVALLAGTLALVGRGFPADREAAGDRVWWTVVAGVATVAVGGLLLTSPLLSPQFLLWLTPWPALIPPGGRRDAPDNGHGDGGDRNGDDGAWAALRALVADRLVAATLVTTGLTGLTLTVFGPAGVARPLPAVLLLVRDGALLVVILVALTRLSRAGRIGDTTAAAPTGA